MRNGSSSKLASMPRIPTGSLYHPKYTDRQGERVATKTWWIRYYKPGNPKRIEESTGTENEAEALQFLRRRMASLGEVETAAERVQIGQLLDMLLADYKQQRRKSTYDVERKIEAQLRPFFGKKFAAKLSTLDLKAYVAQRQQVDKVSNGTINRELAALRRALSLGQQEDPPLVTRIPHFTKLPEADPREGTMDHATYLQLRDLLPDYARLALVISYHTGARRGELLSIRRADVDFRSARILRPGKATKSGKPRYLPIYGDMEGEIRKAIDAGDASCPLLIQRDGMPVDSFKKSWSTACELAGVKGTLFHDLRRTALTNMIDAGLSEKEAMEISGHKTRAVFDRYHIVSDKRLRLNAEKMGNLLAAKDAEAKKEQAKKVSKPQ